MLIVVCRSSDALFRAVYSMDFCRSALDYRSGTSFVADHFAFSCAMQCAL
jgi:hypothetical protein